MKKCNFQVIVIFTISIFAFVFSSCDSHSARNKRQAERILRESGENIKDEVKSDSKVWSKDEELALLAKLRKTTNVDSVYDIYLHGSKKVEIYAYAKWKGLMLAKISKLKDLNVAYSIYLGESDPTIEVAAYRKWEELSLIHIDSISDKDSAYNFYLGISSRDQKVERRAYLRWEGLMLKRIHNIKNINEAHNVYLEVDSKDVRVKSAAQARWKALQKKDYRKI